MDKRKFCPAKNIGRMFGAIGDGKLEGSVLSSDYCIVAPTGECQCHTEEKTK